MFLARAPRPSPLSAGPSAPQGRSPRPDGGLRTPRLLATAALSATLALALSACGSAEDPEDPDGAAESSSPQSSGATPLEPTNTAPSIDPSEDPDDGTQEGPGVDPDDYDDVTQAAVDDLVEREGADAADVRVLADALVQWRSGALGCPEAGMSYTQAITPGRRLILEVDGEQYAYHGAEAGPVSFCASPEEPASE